MASSNMKRDDYEIVHHTPCWIQIPAHSADRAIEFYTNVLDLNIHKPLGWQPKEYIHFNFPDTHHHGNLHGGIFQIPGSSEKVNLHGGQEEGYPMVIFGTENIEETLEKAEKYGGKVILKRTRLTDGEHDSWHACFRDSEGNFVGLYTWQDVKK